MSTLWHPISFGFRSSSVMPCQQWPSQNWTHHESNLTVEVPVKDWDQSSSNPKFSLAHLPSFSCRWNTFSHFQLPVCPIKTSIDVITWPWISLAFPWVLWWTTARVPCFSTAGIWGSASMTSSTAMVGRSCRAIWPSRAASYRGAARAWWVSTQQNDDSTGFSYLRNGTGCAYMTYQESKGAVIHLNWYHLHTCLYSLMGL